MEAAMRRARLVHAAGALAFAVCVLAGRPVRAQNDLSGEWANLLHEDVNHRNDALGGGPRIGDYTGLPINDAARLRADSWDAAINTLREHQTIFAPAAYWARGGGGMRISKVVDDDTQQLIAYKIYRAGAGGSDIRTREPQCTASDHGWRKAVERQCNVPSSISIQAAGNVPHRSPEQRSEKDIGKMREPQPERRTRSHAENRHRKRAD
jgi:hypothetical protein